MIKRFLLLMLLLAIGLAGLGSLRYGGPAGLSRRVQAMLAPHPTPAHPLLVPTPLPTARPSDPTQPGTPELAEVAQVLPKPTAAALATATATVTALIAALSPTPTPSPTPSPTPTATPPAADIPPAVALSGLRHAWQTWNNCGPATLAMHLSYFGSDLSQEDIRLALRPFADDKNVSPEELAAFARDQNFAARVLVNGNADRLRLLLSQGLPVLIETWLEPEPHDGMGHYRLLTGYDDAAQEWIAYDSYVSAGLKRGAPYAGIRLPYAETAALWRVFNRTYLVIYPPAQEALVSSLLAADADAAPMWAGAAAQAQAEIAQQPEDAFAWFNLGSSLAALARDAEAAAAFDQARVLGLPWRMLWYQHGPFPAYLAVGRGQEALALANATLATTQSVEELHYWQGQALLALGDAAAAQASFRRALEINPHYQPAAAALQP